MPHCTVANPSTPVNRSSGSKIEVFRFGEICRHSDAPDPSVHYGCPQLLCCASEVTSLSSAGGFAGSFFAWYEDADLALRLRRAGGRFCCVPAARARHVGSATGRRTPELKWRLLLGNRARTLRRNLAAPACLRALLVHPVPLPALRQAVRDLGFGRMTRVLAGAAADVLSALGEDRAARRGLPLLPRLPE